MKKTNIIIVKIYYSTFCFLFILLASLSHVFCQESVSTVQQQFEIYANKNYQEKVFLHTDKNVYSAGEILWFKAYIVDADSNKLSSLSSICYVEIIGTDGKSLLQAKIDVDSGTGNGSFIIPAFIRSGNYLIRAYTNWMKNFDPTFYFEQSLSIINVNKKVPADTVKTEGYTIQFFPEGGNMVYGLENTVAFKITDAYGKGIQAKGSIANEKNETVLNFETEHFGMGTFLFNPVKGIKYHAVIRLNDKTFNKDLPDIYNTGWALHLKDEGDHVLLTVKSNVEEEANVFLFAQTHNIVKFAKVKPLKNGSADFTINKSELGEGISQLTVFNQEKQPVCERLFFKKPTQLMQVKINNIQQAYQQRMKVDFDVTTNDNNAQASAADLSAAVYLTDSLQPEQHNNLLNYLWLSSDLKGWIESPEYYFQNPGAETDKATDNLMLTQGWRKFKWEDVLKNDSPSFSFLPEYGVHIITGKLLPKVGSLPLTGVPAFLSVQGKDFKFNNSVSSSSGNLKFYVDKFYGSHEIIAQTNLEDSNYRLFIDNPFSDKYSETKLEPLELLPGFANEILSRSIGAQTQNIYQADKRDNFVEPEHDTTTFFGIPSRRYYLDAYTRFPTMEEVMREYVKEVHLRGRQKNFHYEVFNEPEINYFSNDPLVLIDGIPVFDINKIIDIDPLKIRKIDVVTNKFFQGDQQYDGIVSYTTYHEDLDGYQLDPNSLVIEYEGLQLRREFYSPQYETEQQKSSRLPDYRNVLYWLPDLKTTNGQKNLSFYTSDLPGKYTLLIQGISTSGQAGVSATSFIVAP